MAKDETDLSTWVHLNVGGKKFCTTIGTLTQREPESMLAAMFSGRHTLKKEKGYVLIDRNGDYFGYILDWLRDGDVPILDGLSRTQVVKEAEYFQLLGLIDRIKMSAELTRIDVIRCIQSKTRTFRGVNLSGLDLSKLGLSGVDFSHSCLRNVSFSCANLGFAIFCHADIEGVSFDGAYLGHANFSHVNVSGIDGEGVIFDHAILDGCHFFRSKIRGASFVGARLAQGNLESACLINCSFVGADMRSATLENADVTDTDLERAILESADLRGIKLSNTNMNGADLRGAYLND